MGISNNLLFKLLVVLWFALVVTPAAYAFSFFVVNFLIIALLYIQLLMNSGVNFILKKIVLLLPIYILPLLDNFISFGGSQPLYMFMYGVLQNMLLPLLTFVFIKNRDIKNARFALVTFFVLLLFTSITTFIGNINYPGASRELAGVWGKDYALGMFYKSLNIGGFEFVYTVCLSLPLIMGLIRGARQKIIRVYCIILAVVFVMMIIKTEYGLAVVFAGVSIVPLLFKDLTPKKLFITLALAVFGAYLLGNIVLGYIANFAENTESAVFAERFGDMSSLLMGESISDNSDVSVRQSLYEGSWHVFLQHPLFGDPHNQLIGGHSLFLDALANYGLIGLLLIIWTIRVLFINFIKPWKSTKYYYLFIVVLIMQIILLILNTTWLFQVFYVMIPLLGYLEHEKNNIDRTLSIA